MRLCRFTTYRLRFARVAPAPRAKLRFKAKIQRIVDARRTLSAALSSFEPAYGPSRAAFVAVIPDPRAARSSRFSPTARTVDGYHPSSAASSISMLPDSLYDAICMRVANERTTRWISLHNYLVPRAAGRYIIHIHHT